MTTKNFKLKKGEEFIPLNKLLQVFGIAQTGGHAKIMIQNNEVFVNGTIETRVRNKLVKGSEIAVGDYLITIM